MKNNEKQLLNEFSHSNVVNNQINRVDVLGYLEDKGKRINNYNRQIKELNELKDLIKIYIVKKKSKNIRQLLQLANDSSSKQIESSCNLNSRFATRMTFYEDSISYISARGSR